jgi:Tol biopolymer transport system component
MNQAQEFPELRPSRAKWFLLLLLPAGGVGGWYYWTHRPEPPFPNRFMVVVETQDAAGGVGRWWGAGGKVSARFADKLSELLATRGLDPAKATDPKTFEVLAGAEDSDALTGAAASLRAAHLIDGTLATVICEALPEGVGVDCTFQLDLELLGVDPTDSAPETRESLVWHTVALTEEEAMLNAAERLAERAIPWATRGLVKSPALIRIKEGKGRLTQVENSLSKPTNELFRFVQQVDFISARRAREASEAEADNTWQPAGATRLGGYLDEEYFIAPLEGQEVLLMTIPRHVEVHKGLGSYELREGYERLEAVDLATKSRRLVLETYNIYSWPAVSADGKTAVVIRDYQGMAKALVAIEVATGKLEELASHKDHYFSTPRPSPDGTKVAFWYSQGRGEKDSLQVIDRATRKRTVLIPLDHDFELMTVPSWAPDGKTLYLSTEDPLETQRAWAFDVETGTRRPFPKPTLAEGEDPELALALELAYPVVSPDGKTLAALQPTTEDEVELVLVEIPSGTVKKLADGSFDSLAWSPDGRFLLADHGDYDASVIDVASGQVKRVDEQSKVGGWSPDGKTVLVEQRGGDPSGDGHTHRVYALPRP